MNKRWIQRIRDAQIVGYFDADDQEAIRSFSSCMVGELKGIDRCIPYAVPVDERLMELGNLAIAPIDNNQPERAMEIFCKIHRRATVVRRLQRLQKEPMPV